MLALGMKQQRMSPHITYYQRRSVLAIIPGLACEAIASTTSDSLRRVSDYYSSVQGSVSMTVRIWKKSVRLNTARETKRSYRLTENDGALRWEILTTDGKSLATRLLRRDGFLLAYTNHDRQYCVYRLDDPNAQPHLDVLRRFGFELYGRFAGLHENAELRQAKVTEISAGNRKSTGKLMEVKSAHGVKPRWIGTICAAEHPPLIWRFRSLSEGENGGREEQDIQWQEIVTGKAVSPEATEWAIPEGLTQVRDLRLPE